MKLILYLLGLVVLGAVVFVGFAALVAYREGRPLHPPAEVQALRGETERHPLETLMTGARMSTVAAQRSLERGARSEAVHALDAAMRAAEVGTHTAHGQPRDAFEQALKNIQQARRILQNGKPGSAQRHLETTTEGLDTAATAALTP